MEPIPPERAPAFAAGTPSRPLPMGDILLLTGLFFLTFVSRVILSPLLLSVEEEMGLTHGQAGALFLLIYLGYCGSLLPSGFFSSRFSHRAVIASSVSIMGMALLVIASRHTPGGLKIGLLIVGIASGLYMPSGIAMLTSLVPRRDWGKVLAIHELAPNLSFTLAPLLAEAFLRWGSWRLALAILGGASLAMGAIFLRFARRVDIPAQAPTLRNIRWVFSSPSFWTLTVVSTFAVAGNLGIYNMLPLFLVSERGIERGLANTYTALSRIPGALASLLAGWMVDRWGLSRTLVFVLLATALSTILLGILPGIWVVPVVFFQATLAVCFFPPGFAAMSSIGSPALRNVTFSFTLSISVLLGGGAVPAIIGLVGETSSISLAIGLLGVLILGGVPLARSMRLSRR